MHAWSRYAFLTIVNGGITLWTIDKCEWKHGIQSESWSTFDRFFDRRVFTFLHLSQSASYLLERQSQKCAVTPIFTRFAFVEAQLTRHLFVCSRRGRCHSIENWTLCPLRYSCLRNLKRGTQSEANSNRSKVSWVDLVSMSCEESSMSIVSGLFQRSSSALLIVFRLLSLPCNDGRSQVSPRHKRRTWVRGIVRQFTAESMLVSRWWHSHWWFLWKQDETVWPMRKWPGNQSPSVADRHSGAIGVRRNQQLYEYRAQLRSIGMYETRQAHRLWLTTQMLGVSSSSLFGPWIGRQLRSITISMSYRLASVFLP